MLFPLVTVYRSGIKPDPDAEIGQKGAFCKGLNIMQNSTKPSSVPAVSGGTFTGENSGRAGNFIVFTVLFAFHYGSSIDGEAQRRAHFPQVLPGGSDSRVGSKRKSRLAGQRGGFKIRRLSL